MQANKFFPEIQGNLGFGCSRLPVKNGQVDQKQYRRLTDIFLEAGFNYFDTAHDVLDGGAETAFRECVAKLNVILEDVISQIRREDKPASDRL